MTRSNEFAAAMLRLVPGAGAAAGTEAPGRTFCVDARFETGGVWAGVTELVEAAYLGLVALGETAAVTRHDYELYMALPQYRNRLRPRHLCLTDTATGIERTRFYPVERAYRLVHGLVGLFLHWKEALCDTSAWRVIVANFDEAQHLASRFVGELARRAASGARIEIVVQTAATEATSEGAAAAWRPVVDDAAAERLLHAIETGGDDSMEASFPRLLRYYREKKDGVAAANLAFRALAIYNRRGYYHEAKSLLPVILPHFDLLAGAAQAERMSRVSEINSCLVASGDGEQALRMVTDLAVPFITKPQLVANISYIFAMHHLRYLEAKDIERAEHHLLVARDNLRFDEVPEQAFLRAFIDNGLAFLRVRQNRPREALELCEVAYASVTRDLGETRHLLHRSVLQYNMGQVRVMLGDLEGGLACYRTAIGMDPFYAEYHAESGSILERLGRDEEALTCYERALECSPSYPGVYLRQAICHARLEQWPDALRCSGLCLELAPDQPELHAARAEIFVELGRSEAALAEYDRGIAISADSVAMRVNRAVLHFNNGAYDRALEDMDAVIAQEPRLPAHYENRAAIYQAIDRPDLHRRDLALAELYAQAA
jgi:tetratricopeptide (TPR) repeat protein